MQRHVSIASVMEQCCRALFNVTCNNNDNCIKAGSAGAIECVVAAMHAHAGHVEVQQPGCAALRNMTCDNADNKIKAGSAGAIESVVAAMRVHASNADVQNCGCAALCSITFKALWSAWLLRCMRMPTMDTCRGLAVWRSAS
jgi:hypothetical protein